MFMMKVLVLFLVVSGMGGSLISLISISKNYLTRKTNKFTIQLFCIIGTGCSLALLTILVKIFFELIEKM